MVGYCRSLGYITWSGMIDQLKIFPCMSMQENYVKETETRDTFHTISHSVKHQRPEYMDVPWGRAELPQQGKKCTTTLCCKWKRLLESCLLSWRWSRQGHTSTYAVSTLKPLIKIRVKTSLLWFWPWQWCFSVNLMLSKRAWNVSAQASKSCWSVLTTW